MSEAHVPTDMLTCWSYWVIYYAAISNSEYLKY